jgi:hypothetical protein
MVGEREHFKRKRNRRAYGSAETVSRLRVSEKAESDFN